MNISNQKYKLARLTRNWLEEASQILAEMFLTDNEIWSSLKPTLEEVKKFMYDKTSEMLDWED